jgi:PAS domain S-box-containing protein
MRELLESNGPLLLDRPPRGLLAAADAPEPASHRAAALVRLKGTTLGYLLIGRDLDLPPYIAADLTPLQVLADVAGLRLAYSQLAIRPLHRERELAQLAAAWRPPVDLAGDLVVIIDFRGRVVDADGGATRLLGYSRDELLQMAIPDFSPLPPGVDERAALTEFLQRVLDSGTVAYESSTRRRDDSLFPVRVQLEVLERTPEPMIRGIVWDLSERKEAQAQLLRTERLRVLGQMASGVAHDLNNTLAHVLGNLQLLLGYVEDPAQRTLLERVQQAALDGAETVKRLHSFARSREALAETVDLAAVVAEVVELMRPSWEALTQQKGVPVQIVVDCAPVPAVFGNAAELREVLVNLLQNALDALPKGGAVRLHTEATEREVLVTVADTGVGMPPRVRSRIFDPFYTTKGAKGSGLGLSIAYTIVARHKGQITVESEEGHGTTFTLRLPAAPTSPQGLAAPRAPAAASTAPPPRTVGRILAVDDEPELAAMLARMLQKDGHQVQICDDGATALALLAREPFDLLLTDVSMPEMDGWEVARRAKELRADLPVGLMTGWGTQYEGLDLRPRGVDFVLSKPFTIEAARGLVIRALTPVAERGADSRPPAS